MLNFIYLLLALAASLWVYADATKYHIGKVEDGSYFNFQAGTWSFMTFFMGIAVLPLYLVLRKGLRLKAAKHPVVIKNRKFKIVFILVVVLLFVSNVLISRFFPVPDQKVAEIKAWVDEHRVD